MGKVTGVGGIFLKAKDPNALQAWYVEHLGVPNSGGYMSFEGPEAQGTTAFAVFPEDTKYFGDGPQQTMINFRVDALDELLTKLADAGVRIDPHRDNASYGLFAWIWDPEGNRIELWQPIEDTAAEEAKS